MCTSVVVGEIRVHPPPSVGGVSQFLLDGSTHSINLEVSSRDPARCPSLSMIRSVKPAFVSHENNQVKIV